MTGRLPGGGRDLSCQVRTISVRDVDQTGSSSQFYERGNDEKKDI